MTTTDKKRFGAILYEDDKMISIPKAHNGWHLTAWGMKMFDDQQGQEEFFTKLLRANAK